MVISTNLKEDFFDKIVGKHILIISSNGVDSVCTFKIIKNIFKNHNIPFSYSIIKSKSELKTNFVNYGQIDNILLINCGNMIDVIEYLNISDSKNRVIYIIDSQRPIHVNNFYNSSQVKILTMQEDFDYVPEFQSIFTNDDDDDDDSDSDSEGNNAKRARFDKKYLDERIRKREWKKQREDIMYDYENYSFHGTSSSLVAYHLSTLINQDTMDLLWSAIVGHTSQLVFHFINRETYCLYLDLILSYLTKLTANKRDTRKTNLTEVNIENVNELVLWLYRHWSLQEAIKYSPVTMTTFKLCKVSQTRLKEFLAFIGIPHSEYSKIFSSMKLQLKNEVITLFREHCERFEISPDDLFLPSFVANRGYHTKLSAIDSTFIIAATLDNIKEQDEFSKTFLNAVNFLSISDKKQIDTGLALAKDYIKTMNDFTRSVIESRNVITFGSFLQVTVTKKAVATLQAPLMQYLLARYILEATFSVSPKLGKSKNTQLLPLVLCSEMHNKENKIILYGIPPLKSTKGKNLFGQIFDTVLMTIKSEIEQENFDICRIEIHTNDKLRIFNRISTLLSA